MKKESGITIVALVVTIVVMLILVGVSVTVSINGGLFNTTKESTYKTEVSQVKEALEEEIVQRKARRESVDNITIADLDIPNKIKKEFKGKLVFNTKIGDILYTDILDDFVFESFKNDNRYLYYNIYIVILTW